MRWSITEQRYCVLDSRFVLAIYSSQGGQLIEQLPLFDTNSQGLQAVDYPGETFQLTMPANEVHLFHAPAKPDRADWLSSLSLSSQLDTVRRHTAATLIQRVARRLLAVQRFMRLRRYAHDKVSLRKSVQEQLMGAGGSGADFARSSSAGGGRSGGGGLPADSVTEVLIQHEHWGLRGFRGEFLSRIPAAIRVPAWCTDDGVEVAPLTATQAEAQSAGDDRLPNGWKWADAAWSLDRSGSKDPDGWQFARGLPALLGWSSESFIGNLVRRRKWIRVRKKIKVRPRGANANSSVLNSIFVTTRKCTFIGKFKTTSGVVMNIWRPIVPPNYRILGDCISAGEEPPSSFVSIDMDKVANSRPAFMQHWTQEVTQFAKVWSNGSVWAWRPVPPSIPSQLLRRKRLQVRLSFANFMLATLLHSRF